MTMRSIGKYSLGFGMVSIPIKMYVGADDKRRALDIHQFHTECGSRIQQPKYCSQCQQILEKDQVVSGYEVGDKYVPITEEDYDSLPLETLSTIQVDAFTRPLEDPRWYKDSYLLAPEEVGAKAFVLFAKAMEQAGVIGISKFTFRKREHVCAVQPFEGLLILRTLHWGDELRDFTELVPYATVTNQEMEMAGKLIEGMTKDVDPEDYHDEYRQALVELIEAKLEGKTIERPEPKAPKQDKDLAEQLVASLNAMEPAKEASFWG